MPFDRITVTPKPRLDVRRVLSIAKWIAGSAKRHPALVSLPFVDNAACARILADPGSVVDLWSYAQRQMATSMPLAWHDLDQVAQLWLFVTALAHNLKPYGTGPSGVTLDVLLAAKALDCSTYGHLAYHLAVYCADTEALPAAFVGWHGGAIGNHQILMISGETTDSLLLDPTVGVAARISFDQLASGTPCPAINIVELATTPTLAASRAAFVRALLKGEFRPSHLLYYFETRAQLLQAFGAIDAWPTPGAAIWRAENPPRGLA